MGKIFDANKRSNCLKQNNKIKVVLFIFVFCFISLSTYAHAEQLKFDGKNYSVVTNVKAFVEGYKSGTPTMIKIMGKDYKDINNKIMEYATSIGLDYAKVYSPSKVIYGKNNEVLSMKESFKLSGIFFKNTITLGNNPGAQVEDYNNDIFYIPTFSLPTQVTEKDVKNIRKYYKYLATLWWQHQNPNAVITPELPPGSKICDSCNGEVKYGKGYIYGMIEGDYIKANRLYCDKCMDKMINDPTLLPALQNDPNYMGNGLIDKVREYIRSKK